jgi:hypothetical protein
MNKNIEQANFTRAECAYKHALDPIANPDPGSEAASMITISPEEMSSLSVSSIMSNLMSVMPLYLLQILNLQDNDKRKRDDPLSLTDSISTMDTRIAKRRCMDGSKLVPRSASAAVEIAFPQILFDTEVKFSVPLSFFTHSNLWFIIDQASTLPTRRANGKSEAKGPIIIDIEKLADKIGRELSIDFSQYTQASQQMFRFQSLRDSVVDGKWTQCWYQHFQFFECQHDAEQFYPFWKEYELQLRRDRRSLSQDYNENYYDLLYLQAKNNARFQKLLEERDHTDYSRRTLPYSNQNRPTHNSRADDTQRRPFQAGGSRLSAPATCILCAERGHALSHHPPSQQKFPDGKNLWGKVINGRINTLDNKEICINFNIGSS